MTKKIRDENGLTQQEEHFCQLRISGLTQRQAYRHAFDSRKTKDSAVDQLACKLEKRLEVQARQRAILRAAKVQDMTSAGEALDQLKHGIAKAEAAENWTAYAAMVKSALQVNGLLRDNLHITAEQMLDDADLAKRLSKGDPAREAALRAALGGSGFGEETKQTIQ